MKKQERSNNLGKEITSYIILLVAVGAVTTTLIFGYINPMSKGDLNRDGKIDALDLSIMQSNWSDRTVTPKPDAKALQEIKTYLPSVCEKLQSATNPNDQWYECDA